MATKYRGRFRDLVAKTMYRDNFYNHILRESRFEGQTKDDLALFSYNFTENEKTQF